MLFRSQGEIAYRSGRLDEAFTHLYKARLFDPANRPLAYLLARISQKLGKIALCRHLLMGLIEARDTPQDLLQKAKNLLQKI